jgi:surfeit locus 1 family protein
MRQPQPSSERGERPAWVVGLLLVLAAALFAGFCALGVWQIERRAWKLDLIERVDARIHAAPVPAPGPDEWATIDAAADEYRRVQLQGRYLFEATAFVQAVTDLGGGFWAVTPLQNGDGTSVLVNRGFVRDRSAPATPAGVVTVTGLLRLSEPGGGFLRENDASADLWYSRDVEAIAASRNLDGVAPFFVDADRNGQGGEPVGGLTVVQFNNNHLVYVLTWFSLALLVLFAAGYLIRDHRRSRQAAGQ